MYVYLSVYLSKIPGKSLYRLYPLLQWIRFKDGQAHNYACLSGSLVLLSNHRDVEVDAFSEGILFISFYLIFILLYQMI